MQWIFDKKIKNLDLPWAIQQPVGHFLTNPVSWGEEMNISWGSPQNYYDGDRWSRGWCSDTKIPRFLQNSAPLVASGAEVSSIGNIIVFLIVNHEGLSKYGLQAAIKPWKGRNPLKLLRNRASKESLVNRSMKEKCEKFQIFGDFLTFHGLYSSL